MGRVADLTVRSAGDSFTVRLVGSDHDAARDIWERARALAAPSMVNVEQIGASSTSGAAL